jgi:uncharacterized protein (TIGR00251 family)
MECKEAVKDLVNQVSGGCIVKIQVYPSAKKDEILFSNGSIIVKVTSHPRGGKANEDVIRLFRKKLKVKATIVSGFKSRDKILKIQDSDCNEIIDKICGV